ncbi:28S ribosomal protein S2, mitochondrial [Ixodes scapularis]
MALPMRKVVVRLGRCSSFVTQIVRSQHPTTERCLAQQAMPQEKVEEPSKPRVLSPLEHADYFGVSKLISVRELFEARAHLGHKEGLLNDLMKPYIFGSRLGHHIIDLDQTVPHLFRALNFAAHIAYRDGIILFVTRNQQTSHMVEEAAKACGEFAHTRWWRPGLFPNSERQFGTVTRLPDLVVLLSTLDTVFEEHLAVRECARMLIPTAAVVDTNCNPSLVTYPVPGNDDTPSAVELYCRLFKEAILRGKARRAEDARAAADAEGASSFPAASDNRQAEGEETKDRAE